jgi:PAS domain S-box-containing protein
MKDEILLRGLLGVIKQPVFAKDENLIYTFCNQAFADFLGKSKNEIVGKTVFQLYEKELAEIYHKADKNLLKNGGSQEFETSMPYHDGSTHAVILNKNIILDEEENRLMIIGLVEDISALKNKEKELIKSESKYKKFFENVQDIFYQIDVNGNIQEISPSVSKYSDYTHTEIIGQPIEIFYANPEDRNSLLHEIQEKGEALDFEILLKGKNNHLTYASVNAHFIFDEKGQVSGVEGTLRDLTERKQAEEKIKMSLSSLQATLDSTTDGILVVNDHGKITNYNKQFKAIFNVPDGILQSGNDTSALEFVLKLFKDPNQFLSKVQYLYNHPDTDSFDTLEFIDGRIIERYSCPQMLDGKPIGRVWSFRDITVRKKAEQQLHLMAHTLKSINESISITDTNNHILFVNAAFIKTYGYSEKELIGQDISIVRSSENDPMIISNILDITVNTGWQGELMNRKKDGTDFPIMLSTTIINDENGKAIGMVGVAIDISDRKMSEKLLRESEEKYRNLIETMPDGVYRSTHEGKFVELNDAIVKILGYDSKDELMSIDIKSELYFEPNDRESLVLNASSDDLDVFPMKKKDGSVVWIEDHGWYVKDNNDHIIFHEGILRDVTERKLAEFQLKKYSEELQEMNVTKDKFLSIIAHDLKTPFNSILGLSEILKNEIKNFDSDSIEQYISLIYSTSKNTYRLLENLLDWARMQQGKMQFNPRPLILRELVADIFEILNDGALKKQITLFNTIDEQIIIHADLNMIKTVIRNLVSNSIKFTSANGRIEVSAFGVDKFIQVNVKDNGTGIPKADISKLFKIGTSYSHRGTENEVGNGLGLILCEEFVSKHSGKIWVESEVGKGSEFKFTLPC